MTSSSSLNQTAVEHAFEFCSDRFQRGIKQNIFVIDIDTRNQMDANNPRIVFFVCGTTNNTYSVTFGKQNVSCTCMDFQIHEHLCKHIYFLIGKVGKVTLPQIENLFAFGKPALTPLSNFFRRRQKRFHLICNKIVEIIQKNVEEMKRGDGEKDCCICLDTLEKNDRCIDCHECKNLFHSTCINLWLNNKRRCPLCRTNITNNSIRIIVQ